jgi:hypothetical protein
MNIPVQGVFQAIRSAKLPRWRPTRRTLLHGSLALAMTVPATAILALGTAPDALACSQSNHCYSVATNNTGHNNGINGDIYFTCLHTPTTSDFTDDEMWDYTGSGGPLGFYWVEAGVVDGMLQNNPGLTRNWFWADFRPGDSNVNIHVPSGFAEAGYSTDYYDSISFVANQTWSVTGGNSDVNMGTSTGQPNNTVMAQAGSEFTDDQGMRDTGNTNGLQRSDSSNHLHNWASDGHLDTADKGANNNTSPSYDPNTSTISWSQC